MSQTFKALQRAEKERGDVRSAPPIKVDDAPEARPDALGITLPSSLVVERAIEFDQELKKQFRGNSVSLLITAIADVECAARRTMESGAVWVSELGRKVLLIDAAFSKPILHRLCGVPLSGGLSDVGQTEDARIHQLKVVGTSRFLHLMTTGTSGNPAVDPDRIDYLGEWISRTGAGYDRTIVFAGDLNGYRSVGSLTNWLDGVVPIFPLQTPPGKMKRIISRMESSGAKIAGLVTLEV